MFHFPTRAAPQFLLMLTDFLPLKISADLGTENKKIRGTLIALRLQSFELQINVNINILVFFSVTFTASKEHSERRFT